MLYFRYSSLYRPVFFCLTSVLLLHLLHLLSLLSLCSIHLPLPCTRLARLSLAIDPETRVTATPCPCPITTTPITTTDLFASFLLFSNPADSPADALGLVACVPRAWLCLCACDSPLVTLLLRPP